jgi:hypothetical protein
MIPRGTFEQLNPYVVFVHYILAAIIFVISVFMYYEYREGVIDRRLSVLENKQVTLEELKSAQEASFIRFQDQVNNGFIRIEDQISKLSDKVDATLPRN